MYIKDKNHVTVLIKMADVLLGKRSKSESEPICSIENYIRHQMLPKLFLYEWKTDPTIFDLLTAIVLFTPSSSSSHSSSEYSNFLNNQIQLSIFIAFFPSFDNQLFYFLYL